MFLHLRWYGINVDAYRLKAVNVSLPSEDVYRLEMVKKRYNIPYGEIFNRAIFYLRKYIWEPYRKWNRSEMRDKPLPYRSKKYKFPDYEEQGESERHESIRLEMDYKSLGKYRGYSVREQLDEKVREALKDPRFDPGVRFNKLEARKKSRLCFRMKNGDIKLLKDLSKGEADLATCLHYLISKTIRIHQGEGKESSLWARRLIIGYKPHSKITFAVRDFDCREMDEFIDRYKAKYAEELTRSEIVVLAYHLFKRRGKHRQQVALNREKQEGKNRGKVKKISVSFSYEGTNYRKKHKPSPTDLRAALYSLLRSRKFGAFMDADSVKSVGGVA